MMKRINWRGVACCLAGMLLAVTIGCHPAGSSAPAPSTSKTSNPTPDNSGKPGVQPPGPDLGK